MDEYNFANARAASDQERVWRDDGLDPDGYVTVNTHVIHAEDRASEVVGLIYYLTVAHVTYFHGGRFNCKGFVPMIRYMDPSMPRGSSFKQGGDHHEGEGSTAYGAALTEGRRMLAEVVAESDRRMAEYDARMAERRS